MPYTGPWRTSRSEVAECDSFHIYLGQRVFTQLHTAHLDLIHEWVSFGSWWDGSKGLSTRCFVLRLDGMVSLSGHFNVNQDNYPRENNFNDTDQ